MRRSRTPRWRRRRRASRPGRRRRSSARAAVLERAGDLLEARPRPPDRAAAGRRRQDARRCASPRCARRSTSAATTPPRRDARSTPQPMPGPTGETQRAALSRPRRVRLHQPVEFPAGDLPRPGRGGARRRQRGGGQARRADAADRRRGGAAAASRPACRPSALQLVPGDGKVGAALVADPRVAGVAFTGSTEVGRAINRALAAKDGPIVPLIAETGGINAMIVDATALPEQVTDDVVHVGVPLGRPALLGAAAALRAGGRRRPHDRDDRGRGARSWRSAIRAIRRPMSAR